MYPEIETYIARMDEIAKEHRTLSNENYENYLGVWGSSRDPYYLRDRELNRLHVENRAEAWNALKECSDPVVGFIVNNCVSYKDEAREILKILPATFDEMETIARGHNWCDTWDDFVDQATDEGILPERPGDSPELRKLVSWFRDNVSSDRDSITDLKELAREFADAEIRRAGLSTGD